MRRGRRDRRWLRAWAPTVRRALVAAVALGPLTAIPATRQAPTELIVDPELLTRLQTLAEGLHREVVLCLEGSVHGTTAVVDDFVMPTPRLSTPTRSSFDRCPRRTLASWHNHPRAISAASAGDPDPRPASRSVARRLCVLSETDIRTAARLRHPFVVVSVDASTWCWWTLDEVDGFAEAAIAPAPPSPERIARAEQGAAWARPSTIEPD